MEVSGRGMRALNVALDIFIRLKENTHSRFGCRCRTPKDAYMGVTNLEGNMDDCHARNVAEFAIDMIHEASQILIDEDEPSKGCINIRVGFHSGPVVSNVIGYVFVFSTCVDALLLSRQY